MDDVSLVIKSGLYRHSCITCPELLPPIEKTVDMMPRCGRVESEGGIVAQGSQLLQRQYLGAIHIAPIRPFPIRTVARLLKFGSELLVTAMLW